MKIHLVLLHLLGPTDKSCPFESCLHGGPHHPYCSFLLLAVIFLGSEDVPVFNSLSKIRVL